MLTKLQIHKLKNVKFKWHILSPKDSLEWGCKVVRMQADVFRVGFLYDKYNLIKSMNEIMNVVGKELDVKLTYQDKVSVLKELSPTYSNQLITPATDLDDVMIMVDYRISDFWEKLVIKIRNIHKE